MKRFAHFLSLTSVQTFLILLCALLFRLPLLNESFWLDEAAQALESIRPLNQQLTIARDFQPPLLHLIVHFVTYFSHAEWWLRTFGALIPGLVGIFFFYKTTGALFSKKITFISTTLVITSSFHIFYSQELRPYALAAMWAGISWFLLINQLFNPDKKPTAKLSFTTLALYSLSTTLGMYSTYLYPFVVLSQVVYVAILEKKQLTRLLGSLVFSMLLFLPWLPYLWEQLRIGQALRLVLPGWEAVVSIPQLKSIPLTFGKFIFGVLNIEMNWRFLLPSTAIGVLLGVISWQRGSRYFLSKKMILLYCWLFIPLVSAWIVSFWVPILQPKRVLSLLPVWFLFLSVISFEEFAKIPPKVTQLAQSILLILLFSCNFFSTYQYFVNQEYQRENWKALHAKIIRDYPQDTAVIFGFSEAFSPWIWYDDGHYPIFSTGIYSDPKNSGMFEKLKKSTDYPYLLVFDYLRDLTDPGHTIETELHNLGYTERDVFSAPNIGFVRVFARQEAVLSLNQGN